MNNNISNEQLRQFADFIENQNHRPPALLQAILSQEPDAVEDAHILEQHTIYTYL